jgi:hypothetical protein
MNVDDFQDVIFFLKSRFALITEVNPCSINYNPSESASCCCCCSKFESVFHFIASRESLEEEESTAKTSSIIWNVILVRIPSDSSSNSHNLEEILNSCLFPEDADYDDRSIECLLLERNLKKKKDEVKEEKRLLIFEEGTGFCVREVKRVL